MSTDPYSRRVRELFETPRHAGCLDDALQVAVEDQGVRLRLYAELAGDKLGRLRFLAWGCPHTIAAAEAFCDDFEGASARKLLEFSAMDLMQSLSVPVEKTGRILVVEDAVRTLGSAIRPASNPDD